MSDRHGAVYMITNTINGKIYIGSTVRWPARKGGHLWHLRRGTHHNPHLQSAWRKYGERAFVFSVLDQPLISDLIGTEQRYLDVFKPDYNIARDAAMPRLGLKASPETVAKLRAARSRRPPPSTETRQKIAASLRGRRTGPPPAERRQRISQTLMGHAVSEATRAKLRARTASSATREKMRLSRRRFLARGKMVVVAQPLAPIVRKPCA